MDKKTEIKQFCKTMWVMTTREFLPKILIAGALAGFCSYLYVNRDRFGVVNNKNIKKSWVDTKQKQSKALNNAIELQR